MNKKKFVLINLFMSVMVLFAMLFQTIHSYEHIYAQIHENHCDHKYTPGQKQITHIHNVENNCSICHFEFSTFVSNTFYTYTFHKANVPDVQEFIYSPKTTVFFKGSLFALRGPPALA
ncbi:hypothetical protein AAEO57_04990 [Flavobacterium sp. DGU38]|uniref:DUF2946 domain-containing protein n=1 Tax=Flavobacterium calami TaxID=3139144 RepID=A0ABU9IMJ0_9FLAO